MALKKTGLYDMHVAAGGKMVAFAGYEMPIQYSGILQEHKRVRETVGVFDVSHMGEVELRGERALEMVNNLTINDASKIAVNQAQYTAMCYEDGGIVDDLIVYKHADDHYLMVLNAANLDKDFEWIMKHKLDGVTVNNISDEITQLAVQGKAAEATLQKLTDINLADIKFYWFTEGKLAGVDMIISATGYTGEPGFELYFPREHSAAVWKKVFAAGKEFDIAPIGLGARDSLRMEKKYCLYGNDIDETTSPLEAGLGWITKLDQGDFIGRDFLVKQKEAGITRRLVCFVVDGRVIPRKGYSLEKDGEVVGTVTSGCYSPILEKNIGLGYIAKGFNKSGETVELVAGKRRATAEIVKPPFV